MDVQCGERRVDGQARDAGFLGGFPQGGGQDIGVCLVAVPAEPQPTGRTVGAQVRQRGDAGGSRTSAEGVMWLGTYSRGHSPGRTSRNDSTACRGVSSCQSLVV